MCNISYLTKPNVLEGAMGEVTPTSYFSDGYIIFNLGHYMHAKNTNKKVCIYNVQYENIWQAILYGIAKTDNFQNPIN